MVNCLGSRAYGSGLGRTAAQKVYRRVRSSSSVRFRYPLAFFLEEISLNKNTKSNRCLLFTSGCGTLNLNLVQFSILTSTVYLPFSVARVVIQMVPLSSNCEDSSASPHYNTWNCRRRSAIFLKSVR